MAHGAVFWQVLQAAGDSVQTELTSVLISLDVCLMFTVTIDRGTLAEGIRTNVREKSFSRRRIGKEAEPLAVALHQPDRQ